MATVITLSVKGATEKWEHGGASTVFLWETSASWLSSWGQNDLRKYQPVERADWRVAEPGYNCHSGGQAGQSFRKWTSAGQSASGKTDGFDF